MITFYFIMGDFNYPNINWERWNCKGSSDSPDSKFMEYLQDNYMFQYVTKPTRWWLDSPHILDLLLTNEEHMITHLEYQSALGKSDHSVLHFKYNCYTFTMNKRRVKLLYDKADYKAIEEIIRNINWE